MSPAAAPGGIRSFALRPGSALAASRRAGEVVVEGAAGRLVLRLGASSDRSEKGEATLEPVAPIAADSTQAAMVFSAFELLFGASDPDLAALRLEGANWAALLPRLFADGLAVPSPGGAGAPRALAEMVWQYRAGWMGGAAAPFPLRRTADSHPVRPPMPEGTIYARFVPWLGGVLSFDVATPGDLPLLHGWLNDPRVDRFWHEAGDLDRHRRYLEGQRADPHTMPVIGRFEGRAFSYFEIYWARESVLGGCCEAGDHDRGWHVIVGEDAFRGKPWVSAWLPSLMHMIFLDDPRTQRIVGEPAADHHGQIRNLLRSGFDHVDTVDLPSKRAALVSLSRERFFAERRWHPAKDARN